MMINFQEGYKINHEYFNNFKRIYKFIDYISKIYIMVITDDRISPETVYKIKNGLLPFVMGDTLKKLECVIL